MPVSVGDCLRKLIDSSNQTRSIDSLFFAVAHDVQDPHSPACQAHLNMACRCIGSLSLRIPKLEVFIVLLFLKRH